MTSASKSGGWSPLADPPDRFSTGIEDLDRVLGGGYVRGSVALFHLDHSVGTDDLRTLFTPTWLNFLTQSRGLLMVLPARETPSGLRDHLLGHVTRRLFDSRVRLVDYLGEGPEAPYIVPISRAKTARAGKESMRRMVNAERAVQGARRRPFLEWNAIEMMEDLFEPAVAARMLLFGTRRIRAVGNLGILLARPGLGVVDATRAFADTEFGVRRTSAGLALSGLRPSFPERIVAPSLTQPAPHLYLRSVGV